MAWAPEHSAHDAIHRALASAVQGVLRAGGLKEISADCQSAYSCTSPIASVWCVEPWRTKRSRFYKPKCMPSGAWRLISETGKHVIALGERIGAIALGERIGARASS